MRIEQFIASDYPDLQAWVDDLTIAFLNTPTARKLWPYYLRNPQRFFSVSKERAETFISRLPPLAPGSVANSQEMLDQTLLFKNRQIILALTKKRNVRWSGSTSQNGVTILFFELKEVTPIAMLEHLIHEASVLLDPRAYDWVQYFDVQLHAKQNRREPIAEDFEGFDGMNYPAISIAAVTLRAFRLEEQIINELETQIGGRFRGERSFHSPRSEKECRENFLDVMLTLGNHGDKKPSSADEAQIRRKFAEFSQGLDCLELTRPRFDEVPKKFYRYGGPRPLLGGR